MAPWQQFAFHRLLASFDCISIYSSGPLHASLVLVGGVTPFIYAVSHLSGSIIEKMISIYPQAKPPTGLLMRKETFLLDCCRRSTPTGCPLQGLLSFDCFYRKEEITSRADCYCLQQNFVAFQTQSVFPMCSVCSRPGRSHWQTGKVEFGQFQILICWSQAQLILILLLHRFQDIKIIRSINCLFL